MAQNKEWTVYFHGKITVNAISEEMAFDQAYEALFDIGADFKLTEVECDCSERE